MPSTPLGYPNIKASTRVLSELLGTRDRDLEKSSLWSHTMKVMTAGIDGQLETSGKRPTAGARLRSWCPKDWLYKKSAEDVF